MTKPTLVFYAIQLGLTLINFGSVAASASDFNAPLAVSAINGKIELSGGVFGSDVKPSDEIFLGAGSLSLPMGDLLGLQADVAATELNGAAAMGGALHLFKRNPDAYLLGAIGGIAASENASTAWLGGEAELYLENISFEVSAGYLNVKPDAGSHRNELFASGDIAFYPVDNLKMSLGASSVAGFESANARFEYLFETTPVSMSLSGELGEDSYKAVSVGVSFYFGGSDDSKSLKRRHREDDPRNRVLDILNSGAAVLAKSPLTAPVDPEAACNALPDHSWVDGVCRDYSNAR